MRDAYYSGAWAFMLLVNGAAAREGPAGIQRVFAELRQEIHANAAAQCSAVTGDDAERLLDMVERAMPLSAAERDYLRRILARADQPPEAPPAVRQ
ncbi:hypothetical protein [Burkholderia ubonensis]|uniref:hypothetical protein n=1 Tax=Burkholderia ubonensis TaxID=101571 RepID=UPI000F575F71|nr:hypothetical protein [Burkholderia ubonensis]